MKSPIITKILTLSSKISQSENYDELLSMALQLKDMSNSLQADIIRLKKLDKFKRNFKIKE